MLEVAAVADKAYTQVLKSFPDFVTRSSVTVTLVDTLAKAREKHTLAILEGIEQSHENWAQLKVQRSNAETRLLTCTGQLYECLLTEAAHLSPTAFSNILNLSMGLLLSIQHTMPPIQPTIVLTTQAPTLRVLPSMGINFSVAGDAGDRGDAGGDRTQQADDDIPGDHGAKPDEDPEGDGSGDRDNNVIIVSSPAHRVTRHSVTPLSTGGCDVDVGSTSGGMAIDSSRISGGSKASSPCLFSPDRLKLTPSMSTATAQMLIWSTHELLDHPNKSPWKTTNLSDDEGTLEHTASFDNEGQVTSPQEDEAEEDDIDLLADPGDLATQAQREAAVAKIRPSVWAEDAADMKRIKQKQIPLGQVSDKLLFYIFDPKLVLEDILYLIVSRLSPEVFIDHCTTAAYKPNLDIPHIKHMYLKFKYV